MTTTYETERDRLALLAAKRSATGRDVGAIPDIANVRRRARCRKSLRLFCETYNPALFFMPWSADHLRAIARIEEAATAGALYALAMPRGSGKTTICRMAALWAISYSLCRYAFVIGATATKAKETLDAIQTLVRYLPDYVADFPEVSVPAIHIRGIAQRAAGQVCGGESTLIEWSADRIVMPTVPPPANWPRSWPLRSDGMVPTSGRVVSASGLTGEGIRGSLMTLTTGEMVRPDFVLLDDPQTPESARNPIQNMTRLKLVGADVLGMAGPGKTIAAVMPCTVIEVGDMADQVLDREKHPLWRGERTGILRSMPSDLDAWDAYFEVYGRCALKEPPDYSESNEHYEANREALDKGTVAAWEARKNASEISAIQSAMHLYFRDKRSFWAEYMNRPLDDQLTAFGKELVAAAVADRCNGVEKGTVPAECTRLTAGFDAGGELCWYAVVGWDERFSGSVIDYGCWPRQNRSVFEARDARPGLSEAYPGYSESQRVFAGLRDLTAAVLGRPYFRTGGGELKIERALADRGWQPDAVTKVVRASNFAGLLMPSIGIGRTTTRTGVSEWKPRPGERPGYHWRITAGEGGRGRMTQFDPDAWKTFLWERLTTPMGGAGALTLPGKSPAAHLLLSEHCAAEYAEPVTIRGATFDKWRKRPTNPDNHLWDALVLAAVAASVAGVRWEPSSSPTGPAPERQGRKGVDFAELVKRNRAMNAGRR